MPTVLPLHYGVPQRCGAATYRADSSLCAKPQRIEEARLRPASTIWMDGSACRPWRMSQQPELSSSSTHNNSPSASGATTPSDSATLVPDALIGIPQQRIPHWLMRTELYLRVLLRMYIGLAICYAPWSQLFWDQNPLFVQFPTLAIYAANGAVRGIISGLGLLNIWIALQDAIRHRNE